MSSFPRYDLSSQYTYVSAAMQEGLGEVIKEDYSITPKRIPMRVLDGAQELFETAVKVINEQEPPLVKELTIGLMVSDHLRAINPKRYHKVETLHQDIRSLATLLKDFENWRQVPEDQREFIPVLQKFFGLLSNTGESAIYEHHMSGEDWNGRYSLEIGM